MVLSGECVGFHGSEASMRCVGYREENTEAHGGGPGKIRGNVMGRLSLCRLWAALLLPIAALAAQPAGPTETMGEAVVQFDIRPQPMAEALTMLADQADLQILFTSESVKGLTAQGLTGAMSPGVALAALLAGTPLEYVRKRHDVFVVRNRADSEEAGAAPTPGRGGERKGQPSDTSGRLTGKRIAGDGSGARRSTALGEVIVTGTLIRGAVPVGAQIIGMDRSDIDRTGLATVQDVVRTLPQNFDGGATEDTLLGLEAQTNSAQGTALNLRGLGAGATLVLLNGRRIAPGGSEGAFTDVSNVPLAAIERIDVLPDGASALYGSDAVGGVVNLVLRDDYDSAETEARAGAVTAGALDEYQLAQTFGAQWSDGSGLLALEYYERGALAADDRDLAVSDLRGFGGDNFDTREGNPGTLIAGTQTWAIPRGQDGTALSPADLTAGTANLYDLRSGSDLHPEQQRASALVSVRQELRDGVGFFADALYSHREAKAVSTGLRALLVVPDTNPFYVNPAGGTDPVIVAYSFLDDLGPLTQDVEVETINGALGARAAIGNDWQLTGYGAYALEEQRANLRGAVDFVALAAALADPDPAAAFNPFGDGSNTSAATLALIRTHQRPTTHSDLRSINVTVDGPLAHWAGGNLKIAVGVDHREQAFDAANEMIAASSRSAIRSEFDRRITAAFGELVVPFIGAGNRRRGFERLELSVAGRYETYSDFGDTAVPGVGIVWSPAPDIALRATWSESFKAPNLADLDEMNNGSLIAVLADPQSPGGSAPMLVWFGKNADLQEGRATSWTLGLELIPRRLGGLSIGLTYFDIDFSGRVQEIASAFPDLTDPRVAPFVNRNPTPEQRTAICSRSEFFGNPADCLAAPIGAIADVRVQNIAISRTRGIDMLGKYEFANPLGDFSLGLNATWLFEFSQAVARTSPVLDLLDTQNNPLDLHVRSSLSWSRLGFDSTLTLNYADSYRDVASEPNRRVGSWTTFDWRLGYEWDEEGWLGGSAVSISMQNLFDRDPPFLNNAVGIGYDQENADLIGRFIRLHFRKNW